MKLHKIKGGLMVALRQPGNLLRPARKGSTRSRGRGRGPGFPTLSIAVLILWMLQSVSAQNLINTGQITNTGTIRVKNQASGLPASVNGAIEYFGANQTVEARQYQNLTLTGSGTKTSLGGDFSVAGSLNVANGVVFSIEGGRTLTLLGTLTEQGYLSGSINKTVNLTGGTTSSAFGNIGAGISWSGGAPGQTTVTRVSGSVSTGNGNQSILRYYDVATTFSSPINGSFTFKFSANELNGLDSMSLELWRSPDGGLTWRRQGGTNFPGLSTIVKTGIMSFSRWTASDTSHLLGPAAYEWAPSDLASTSGGGQSAPAASILSPFVVTITDYYGNPVPGATVTFVVDSIPSGASGYSLSSSSATTDAVGQASTSLTLGNTAGLYRVRASSPGLAGSPQTFTAIATSAAAAMQFDSGTGQSDTIRTVLSPFAIRIEDAAGNAVPGVLVDFAITKVPAAGTGAAISVSTATTNGLGIASTTLRLGTKAGDYEVTATTTALPGVQNVFTASARPGVAASLASVGGVAAQQDTILQSLDTLFTVRILDSGGNGVPNKPVQFTIAGAPAGATGQALSIITGLSDTTGLAWTRLTLGSRIGTYQVNATAAGLANSPAIFTAQALHGSPASLAQALGDKQLKPVTSVLDTAFSARITDIGGNPIQGVQVNFAVTSVPTGAAGYGLSRVVDTTDVNGLASSVLTLGTKAGAYQVMATSPVLAADTSRFTASGLAAAASTMLAVSGDNQSQPAGSLLAQPMVVTVQDPFGNAVSGVTVRFNVTSSPGSATGFALIPDTVVTDQNGNAATTLRLGSLPGTYVVTATVSGAMTAQFTADASFIVADLNNDFEVDVADLTSIIDHILHRRTLTGIDSVKADVNRDGAINVLDIVRIQNALLGTAALQKSATATTPAMPALAAPPTITGTLEITPVGVRFNLTNDVPLKGVQLTLVLKTSATVAKTDVVFPRANRMQFFVNSFGQEVRMLAYNLENNPINAGDGSIVRLPLILADTSDVDSIYAVVSTADTSFDVAIKVSVSKARTIYPNTFALLQNYPNPFNSQTKIEFDVPDVQGKFAKALVQVFNLLGQKVKTLAKGQHTAGHYVVTWDGTDDDGMKVASGVYFYRLVSNDFVTAKKMVMIK